MLRISETCYAALLLLTLPLAPACGGDDAPALVSLKNDFNNPAAPAQPPWTICHASYGGVVFDKVLLGQTSAARSVPAGLAPVLMVGAWADPDCKPERCLPLATKIDEETLPGQQRTITLTMTNHQGPCPPEGVAPIPEARYEQIRALWPEYGFKPYADRAQNPQCVKK